MDRLTSVWTIVLGAVGVFVVMEALRLAAKKKIKCALFAVSTVQEELGLRDALCCRQQDVPESHR